MSYIPNKTLKKKQQQGEVFITFPSLSCNMLRMGSGISLQNTTDFQVIGSDRSGKHALYLSTKRRHRLSSSSSAAPMAATGIFIFDSSGTGDIGSAPKLSASAFAPWKAGGCDLRRGHGAAVLYKVPFGTHLRVESLLNPVGVLPNNFSERNDSLLILRSDSLK